MGWPKVCGFIKGATTYGMWVGPLQFEWPYWRFMRIGIRPRLYVDFGAYED